MSEITRNWLRQTAKRLPSVRATLVTPNGESDLIIRTWVGMSVQVYLLDGIPNLRALRRVLHENTNNYHRASLFIIHHTLMPPDKKRLRPDDWMHALHELNSQRIYTYLPDQEGIQQVHFDYLPDGIKREAWHGGWVTFEKLRVLTVTAKTRAIRGQWITADFGPNPYWRKSEQRAERMRQRWRHGPQDFTWSRYDMGGIPGGATDADLHRAHMNELERSFDVLGLSLEASQEDVKAAFRKLARRYHPDVSELETQEAQARFQEINIAYETIKTKKNW